KGVMIGIRFTASGLAAISIPTARPVRIVAPLPGEFGEKLGPEPNSAFGRIGIDVDAMRSCVHDSYCVHEGIRASRRQPMALEILYHDTNTRWARRRETLSGRVVAECAFNFN